jgi:Family of unknown function (DUF5999)
MCQHQPRCPDWRAPDRLAARVLASQPSQGWHLLCNGIILFDDGGALLPSGQASTPAEARPAALAALAAGPPR